MISNKLKSKLYTSASLKMLKMRNMAESIRKIKRSDKKKDKQQVEERSKVVCDYILMPEVDKTDEIDKDIYLEIGDDEIEGYWQ